MQQAEKLVGQSASRSSALPQLAVPGTVFSCPAQMHGKQALCQKGLT